MNEDYEYNYDNLVPVWNYEEFTHLVKVEKPRTNFARAYLYKDGEFYLEPWFYTQMTRLFERFPEQKESIMQAFFTLADKHKYVVFTRDINDPVFKDENYLYFEISEVVSLSALAFDDISRGSDYGD